MERESLLVISRVIIGSLSDLKRVIYEVFCHVVRGDLKHDDVISLLSDVTVRKGNQICFVVLFTNCSGRDHLFVYGLVLGICAAMKW